MTEYLCLSDLLDSDLSSYEYFCSLPENIKQKIEMEEEEGVTVITYRKENRIQAIQKAKELRAQGRNVALRPEKVTKVCEVEL